MKTRALRTLVKIASEGSFVQSAEQLGITLSALSMQMKALEAELGVALFDRSHRPPRLTPLGAAVVAEARVLLAREDRLLELCRPSDALVGHFKLGFVTTAAVRLLPDFLRAAQEAAPLANFAVETGLSAVLQEKVLNGQIDAAVVTDADGLPPRLSSSVLRREPFVFAAHDDLMAGGLEGLMAHHTFFHFMPDTGIGKLIARAMLDQARPEGVRSIVLDDLEAIMECVAAGLGFTLLPVPDVERYLTRSVRTLPAPDGLERKLVLAVMRDGALASREAALRALFETP
ncbi:LysR family transcriptional regulator [Rhodobacteraceae bacterium N5(2021)]|uniref:LysR family transcriptional regulator n=1 Tax=Gymnodinialimonas phycosphaerae TaxID=2841589 RepID=A0A975TV29_9RHOB|nr:LysR family transcriptional regulator [Gymnodinialimonas phycosphaerae]MBY4895288.1 LysR family transcriptional regulator [Gymnodinialimonas phycosphaerae]